jgi:hypothetical protein
VMHAEEGLVVPCQVIQPFRYKSLPGTMHSGSLVRENHCTQNDLYIIGDLASLLRINGSHCQASWMAPKNSASDKGCAHVIFPSLIG